MSVGTWRLDAAPKKDKERTKKNIRDTEGAAYRRDPEESVQRAKMEGNRRIGGKWSPSELWEERHQGKKRDKFRR